MITNIIANQPGFMVFNSTTFAVFFALFFLLYWFVFNRNLKLQNLFVLISSYVFYAWWDWRFLFLLIGNTLVNFIIGISLAKTQNVQYRKILLALGLAQGLGGLILFKYFDFFVVSFIQLFASFNIQLDIHPLNLILPLGISFYTFRTLSYLFDINKGKIAPTYDWVAFFSYVSFFPCLISGPIDRPKTLIPQLETKRIFIYDAAVDGLRQILWGLFKKIVIADNCAVVTNQIFDQYEILPASSLVLGAFLYTIQVYADFSGYSDMAIGIARLMGFSVTKNFDFPFFSQNIAEFWRKWHISLTTWFTEYIFTPLTISFRDYDKMGLIMAIMINFIIVGIWHGANWTFLLFGFLHGCYFIPLILRGTMNKNKKIPKGKLFPPFDAVLNIAGTFILAMFTFIIFRSDSITQAFDYYGRLFSFSLFSVPEELPVVTLFLIGIFMIIEWLGRNGDFAIQPWSSKWSRPVRWALYCTLIFAIISFSGNEQDFIYFQF